MTVIQNQKFSIARDHSIDWFAVTTFGELEALLTSNGDSYIRINSWTVPGMPLGAGPETDKGVDFSAAITIIKTDSDVVEYSTAFDSATDTPMYGGCTVYLLTTAELRHRQFMIGDDQDLYFHKIIAEAGEGLHLFASGCW